MILVEEYLTDLQLPDLEVIEELQQQYSHYIEENFPEALTEALNPFFLPIYVVEYFLQAFVFYQTSKPDKKLTSFVQKLLKTSRWKVKIIDFEDKEKIYNAFSVGMNTVFLTEDLKKALTFKESVAISLHEISHSKTWDVQLGFLAEMTTGFVALLATVAIAVAAGVATPVLAVLLFMFNLSVASVADNAISRRMEMKSDSFVAKHGFGDELVSSLKKVDKLNKIRPTECKSNFCKLGKKIDNLMSTHPETRVRIENILKKKEFYNALLRGPSRLMAFVKKEY